MSTKEFSGYQRRAQFPHCDSNVLHAPGECIYCDEFPDFQAARKDAGVNFTGHSDPALKPCPATEKRPVEQIEAWFGNRRFPNPMPAQEPA